VPWNPTIQFYNKTYNKYPVKIVVVYQGKYETKENKINILHVLFGLYYNCLTYLISERVIFAFLV